jgi:hypothetical protein
LPKADAYDCLAIFLGLGLITGLSVVLLLQITSTEAYIIARRTGKNYSVPYVFSLAGIMIPSQAVTLIPASKP